MNINSRNLGQQEEDLDKKKFRKRASMSRPTVHTVQCTAPRHQTIHNKNIRYLQSEHSHCNEFTE